MHHESKFKLYRRHKSNPRLKIITLKNSSMSFLKHQNSKDRLPSTRESTYLPTQEDEKTEETKRNYLFDIFLQLKRELLLEKISPTIRKTISTPEPELQEYSLKNPSSFTSMIISLLKLYFKDEKNY